jgi:hypothetical protein
MRKITQEAVVAFYNRKQFKKDNTRVDVDATIAHMYLFNNRIATINANGLFITTAGWDTPTTKERLNGLRGVHVYTYKGQLYLNGKEWDGREIKVEL